MNPLNIRTTASRTGLLAAFLMLLSGIAATAQTPVSLSLEEAITVALENNRDLKVSRLDLETADAQVDEAFGNALPTLDLNGRYTYNFKRPVFFFPDNEGRVRPIEIGSKNAISADLTLQQILFNSAVFTGVGTAEIYAQISRQQLRAKTSEVVLNVKQAYNTALIAQEVLKVNETLLTNAEANYKDTRALFEAGLRAEFDAIRAEVAVANQRPQVVDARNNYQSALDNLKYLLGYENLAETELTLTGSLPGASTLGTAGMSYDEGVAVMMESNPQIETLRLTGDVNKELVTIRKSDYLPTLALFATYKYEGQANTFDSLSFEPSAYAGLNLSLNILNGGKTKAQVGQAEVEYDKVRYQRAQLIAGLKTRLESVLRRIDYARERIQASDRTIEQADKAYRIAVTTYRAGTGTQLQINDADLALAQARLNQLNAVYDYTLAMAELESLLGRNVRLIGDDIEYRSN